MGEPPIRPHVRLAGGIPVHFAAIRSRKIQRGRQLGDRPHCGSALGEHRVGLGDRDFELVLHLGARLTGFDAKHFDLAANLGERRQMLSWLFGRLGRAANGDGKDYPVQLRRNRVLNDAIENF